MAQPQGTKITFDHRMIQKWVEERRGKPVKIQPEDEEVEEPVELLKVKFPGEKTRNIMPITWEEFFKEFDEEGLAFQFRDETPDGEESHFYKLIYK